MKKAEQVCLASIHHPPRSSCLKTRNPRLSEERLLIYRAYTQSSLCLAIVADAGVVELDYAVQDCRFYHMTYRQLTQSRTFPY
jgi:hypothetical protein